MTVSPNYAREIMSGPDLGVELDTVLRQIGGVTGIINGMDVTEWDPSSDKYLPVPFDATTIANKGAIKEALQAEVGLPVDPSVPLIVFIGRLEEQKGSDILYEALPAILEEDVQVRRLREKGVGHAPAIRRVPLPAAGPAASRPRPSPPHPSPSYPYLSSALL